jgi:hypothetical protein
LMITGIQQRRLGRHGRALAEPDHASLLAVIIAVTSVDKRKMILWQSLHVKVNRDTHGQGSASGDDDQH